jgi:hypothetical protein
VFDPLGRSPTKEFYEPNPYELVLDIMAIYPNEFGIPRPLPSGVHTVVWTTTRDRNEIGRSTFLVEDDRGDLADLREMLITFRETGQNLLDALPSIEDLPEWDKHAETWATVLEVYFNMSPHLGEGEAKALETWGGPSTDPKQRAAKAVRHRLDRIDTNLRRFADPSTESESKGGSE